MSMPPQGGWQPPQPPGPPPNQGQPYGQPITPSGYNPEQPPPGRHQGPWQPQPGPPPQEGNGLKWLLIAVAILLVIGISVGATLIFTRGDGGGGGTATSTSGAPSDIASANDTGPVAIITDEPTCAAFNSLNNGLAELEPYGWGAQRATFGPASDWTSDQRNQVETVAASMRKAADQAVPLAKRTPHRVVRELYEQFIAYGRAYADSVPSYTPKDNELASANINASSALLGVCNAIENGATSRSLAIEPAKPPTQTAKTGDPSEPERFVGSSGPSCTSWTTRLDSFNAATVDWQKRDGSIPASQWTPEQRALVDATEPQLMSYANDIEKIGRQSGNPVFEDFALTAALYVRAFVSSANNYTSADGWLNYAGFRIANLISSACHAVGE
jgi:hypothetical protein